MTGFPRSGTHATTKAVQLLGVPARQAHIPHAERGTEQGRTVRVLVVRHPRDVLISWVRFFRGQTASGLIMTEARDYAGTGRSLPDSYRDYLGWRDEPGVIAVSYERLTTDGGEELSRLAAHLGVDPVPEDAYESIPGLTVTWTGELSRWRDHWCDAIAQAWSDAGGEEIEAELGYG